MGIIINYNPQMKSVFAVAAIGAVSALEGTSQQQFEFMQFIANHGKSYQTAKEFGIRFARYVLADAYIVANNANPKSTHVASHNPLSDSTEKEFTKMLGTSEKSESDHSALEHEVLEGEILTGTKNWTGSCSTPVKDQGQCGSCWSFAGTTVVETTSCIKTSSLKVLSTQQNVDCNTGCYGCDGGWAYKAFNYFKTYGAEQVRLPLHWSRWYLQVLCKQEHWHQNHRIQERRCQHHLHDLCCQQWSPRCRHQRLQLRLPDLQERSLVRNVLHLLQPCRHSRRLQHRRLHSLLDRP